MTLSNASKNAPERRNITEMGLFVSCQDRTQRNGILESQHTLFPGTSGQRKNSTFKMFILTLWKRVIVCSILASFSVKNNYIFANAMKNKRTFFFLRCLLQGMNCTWKLAKNSQKPSFSGAPSTQQWRNGLCSLIYCRLYQWPQACQVLAYLHVLSFCFIFKLRGKIYKNSQKLKKIKNVVIYGSFSLLQECPPKV